MKIDNLKPNSIFHIGKIGEPMFFLKGPENLQYVKDYYNLYLVDPIMVNQLVKLEYLPKNYLD